MNDLGVRPQREGVTALAETEGKAKRISAGTLLLSFKLTIGRVGIAETDLFPNEAIVALFPRRDVHRDYLRLALEGVDWSQYGNPAVKGRTLNRESLDAVALMLPPIEEQRRIVDLMSYVDRQVTALTAEQFATRNAIGPLMQSASLSAGNWPLRRLGEVGSFNRGKRFTKSDYTDQGIGVIHYSHLHTHLGPVTHRTLAFVPTNMREKLRFATSGDVVIACTSEDLEGVGRATVWLGEEDVAVHDDAHIFRHDLDPLFASFLFASPGFNSQKSRYAGGTKVTRISGADLAKIEVSIPSRSVQESVGKALASVNAKAESLAVELKSLRNLRSTLLSALLSQDVEIPESYDDALSSLQG